MRIDYEGGGGVYKKKVPAILSVYTHLCQAVGYGAVCATKYLIYNYSMVRGQQRTQRERAPQKPKGKTMTMRVEGTRDGNEGVGV